MKKQYPGFTLVELLTVIAIIGILAAILIPAVGGAMRRAQEQGYVANAMGIARAHQTYTLDRNRSPNPDTIASLGDFAALMVQHGYLESAEPFFSSNDPLAPDPLPRSLAVKSGDEWKASPQFESVEAYSVDVAIGIPTNAPASTTPLVWARGLTTTGEWSEDGIWGSGRGFIIYADGHSEIMTEVGSGDDARLLHYQNRTPTSNVLEALGSRVMVRGKGKGSLDGSSGSGS